MPTPPRGKRRSLANLPTRDLVAELRTADEMLRMESRYDGIDTDLIHGIIGSVMTAMISEIEMRYDIEDAVNRWTADASDNRSYTQVVIDALPDSALS